MQIITKVRQVMKTLINAKKNLTISRDADVFTEVAFNFDMQSITYGKQRQVANCTIQYLVSPNPDSTNTAPSVTYDQIISAFDSAKAQAFKDADLIILGYSYEQSDVDVDPTTGTVSLSFSINILVTEKTR
ncbi:MULTISPECIES: hypothetical protein [unclassified Enterobacter]|uniref:hypothetical protein n=1 Tax=unclassified Enterobacter TaxID=2608935 RepID=UPI000F4863B5|nr:MULTISPECIES: hypothetical protein [unclassified Enterobacter]